MASKQPARRPAQPERRRFRILPMTLIMLGLVLVLRLNAIYFNVQDVREAYAADAPKTEEAAAKPADAAGAAKEEAKGEAKPADAAASAEEAKKEEAPKDEAKKEDAAKEGEAKKEDAKEGEHKAEAKEEGHGEHGEGEAKPPEEAKTAGAGKTTIKEIEEVKAKQTGELYTKDELDLLQNLTKRRQELEQRESELDLKSKVLDATEKRINDKLSEMKSMKDELGKVVAEYNGQQTSQIGSLVKIYENMKPSDAAKIFNELDMPILLEVIDKMSERKVAPVLAGMDAKKARDVTQELAELRRSQGAKKTALQAAAK